MFAGSIFADICKKLTARGHNPHGIDPCKHDFGVWYQGNFTIALVFDERGAIMSVGISKRNPADKDDLTRAQINAFVRAVRGESTPFFEERGDKQ